MKFYVGTWQVTLSQGEGLKWEYTIVSPKGLNTKYSCWTGDKDAAAFIARRTVVELQKRYTYDT